MNIDQACETAVQKGEREMLVIVGAGVSDRDLGSLIGQVKAKGLGVVVITDRFVESSTKAIMAPPKNQGPRGRWG